MSLFQSNVNGLGRGSGEHSTRGSSGAGHGGTGGRGKGDVNVGTFYGNVFHPTSFGSAGGGGRSPGGGIIKITTRELHVDGSIESKGGFNKNDTNHGGGSGGSIYINTTIFAGEGTVDTSGGSGNYNGGGGSGGRIAVYYEYSSFAGQFAAFGGSSSHEAGAAGTVFQKDYRQNLNYLWVSNKNQKSLTSFVHFTNPSKGNALTWLPSLSIDTYYHFHEVTLTGGSHLAVESSRRVTKMVIGKLRDVGRGISSYLHTGQWQNISVRETGVIFPVNIHVYKNGTLGLPASIEVRNTVFNCDGRLRGLKKFAVSEATVNFGVNSGLITDDRFSSGRFVFDEVTVKAAGKILFKNAEQGNVLETMRLVVKAKGSIQARMLTVRSGVIVVEETGRIDVDGQGFEQGAAHNSYGGKCNPEMLG